MWNKDNKTKISWPPETLAKFEANANCLKKQYDKFSIPELNFTVNLFSF